MFTRASGWSSRLRATARPTSPPPEAPAQNHATAALPRSIQRAIDQAPVRPGRWQYIVIHHSGVDTGTVKAMDTYHREVRHMENGLAYDFVIGNGSGMGDGEIAVGRRWTLQLDGGHLASEAQNKVALGICLVGNFDEHRPTPREMDEPSGPGGGAHGPVQTHAPRRQDTPADQHRAHALPGDEVSHQELPRFAPLAGPLRTGSKGRERAGGRMRKPKTSFKRG